MNRCRCFPRLSIMLTGNDVLSGPQNTVALNTKLKKLADLIRREGRVAIACSGGVDSTLLLKVSHDVLGHENTIAVFAETPLLLPDEIESTKKMVQFVGSRLLTVPLNPLSWPEFTENQRKRCYLCKKKIYQAFMEKMAGYDFSILMDGTNYDDLSDFRPGLKALKELLVRTPLADAELSKNEIRLLSKNLNLPNWDKHSSSCLATRVAAGEQINAQKLALIAECENFLRSLDFQGCRVRLANDSATVELLEEDIERFARKATRQRVLRKFNDFNIKNILLAISSRNGLFT